MLLNILSYHFSIHLDLIICSSSSQTDLGHNKYTKRFVSFCREIKMWNIKLKQHESLKYFIKTTDHNCTDEQSLCVCDDECSFICNWSLETVSLALKKLGSSSAVVNPPDDIESALGLPNKSVISAGELCFILLTLFHHTSISYLFRSKCSFRRVKESIDCWIFRCKVERNHPS